MLHPYGWELCVSYSGLLLNPAMVDMFPQPPAAAARGALQLLDEMCVQGGLPHGYLEQFVARFESEVRPAAVQVDCVCV